MSALDARMTSRVSRARVEIVSAASLAAEGGAWDDLMTRALAPHPHYSRHAIGAHRANGLAPADLSVVIVRRGERLDAALPFRLARDASALGGVVARPLLSPFITSTAPLLADGPDLPETASALVQGLREASREKPWRWPLLSTRAPVGAAMIAAMRAAGWAIAEIDRFARPILVRRASQDAFLDGHPHRSRLKDLRRRQRRLAEAGTLRLETVTRGPGLSAAVEAFMTLEKHGWKGKAGAALACDPRHAGFARALFAEGGGPVSPRADILRLDGRPLAISLALVAGGSACLLKTAYDEAERASAPGLVLEAEIVGALHENAFADRLDSATLAGSALESLYRESESVAEIIAAPRGPGGLLSLDRRAWLAQAERVARERVKRLLRKR